jgi:NTE family protein
MSRKRIAIACQGGGSQCAFVAGALNALFAEQVQHRFRIVGLSGTSGGALTAAVAWMGLLQQARGDQRPIEDRILCCWSDLTAQTPREQLFDNVCVELVRLTEQGLLPSVASSPSSLFFRSWARGVSMLIGRPEFTDIRALLLKHVDFAALPSLIEPQSPVLLVGACDIMEGTFRVFSSARGEINVDALQASAAIPTLFPAVWVDGHPYWDGIFSSNPPIVGFLREPLMGKGMLPEEIWVIQVNRTQHDFVPEKPSDIFDRRNHLAGNLSLQHEIQIIQMVNALLQENALTDAFRARFGLDTDSQIAVRFIRMSNKLAQGLDYPSKLSRQPKHIARLVADGQAQATAFLDALREDEGPRDVAADSAPIQQAGITEAWP